MSEFPITATLSLPEWQLIEAIRAIPENTVRDRTHEVLGEMLYYVQNSRCQGIGAEGFPCGEPVSTCNECHQVWDVLDAITTRLKRSSADI